MMNVSWLTTGFVLGGLLCAAAQNNLTDTSQGETALKQLRRSGQYESLREAVAAARYSVETDASGRMRFHSPTQRLRAEFVPGAVWLEHPEAGRFAFTLAEVGRGTERRKPVSAKPAVSGARVEYQRGTGLVEWWQNGAQGLEQGFTLAQQPSGAGPLELALRLDGGVRVESDDSRGVRLVRNGRPVLRYSGLKSWDADGHTLPSRMEASGSEIHLIVDDAGAHYPVTVDPWVQEVKLRASDAAAGDSFGHAVALSGDTAVIGAPYDDGGKGTAYVFTRTDSGWTQQAKLSPGGSSGLFGYSVALSGETALIGARDDSERGFVVGAAYVFTRTGAVWTKQAKLMADDGEPGDQLGIAVALSGDTALAGAFAAYQGSTLAAGAAYVFTRSGTVWTQQAKLSASDPGEAEWFGWAVALAGDRAIVGAPQDSNEGGSKAGAAYVFTRTGTAWAQQAKLRAGDGAANDGFGASVALSGDRALIGSHSDDNEGGQDAGAAYVFTRSDTVWTEEVKLRASDGAQSGEFGWSVALSGDTALIGAFGAGIGGADSAGAAYLFTKAGAVWNQTKLSASDAGAGDRFGYSVALSGDRALIGTPLDDNEGGTDAGSAYLFRLITYVSVTIESGPLGMNFTVSGDGCDPGSYITPKFFSWVTHSSCTVTFDSLQPGSAGFRYAFTGWGDGPTSAARTFVVEASAAYTAQFKVQVQLLTLVSPAGAGAVSGAGYYDVGTTVPVMATPNASYNFLNWTGMVASPTSASTTVFLNAPKSVTANFQLITTTTVSPAAGQYSDPVYLSATIGPAGAVFTGTLQFAVGGVNAGGPIDVSGAGTYPLPYIVSLGAGAYTVTAVLTSSTPLAAGSNGSNTLTVVREQATLTPAVSSSAVAVSAPGGNAGPFMLASMLMQAVDGSSGNLSLADVTVTLTPVIAGGPNISCPVAITGPAANATCTSVPVNAYKVEWRVGGNYFSAPPVDTALVVFDPSLLVAGSGAVLGNGGRANFAFSAKFLSDGTLQGGLTYTERRETGDVVVNTTSLTALSKVGTTVVLMGQATVNGVAGRTVLLTVTDNGASNDRFGLQISGDSLTPPISFAPAPLVAGDLQTR